MSEPAEGRSDDQGKEACEHRRQRKAEAKAERGLAWTGRFFVAIGLAVFFAEPEHGATIALFLVGFGCLMINTKLAKMIIPKAGE